MEEPSTLSKTALMQKTRKVSFDNSSIETYLHRFFYPLAQTKKRHSAQANAEGDNKMKLSDINDLLQHYRSPDDWMRVDNESHNGGDTLVCLEDVLLCIKFNPVWNGNKPFMRLELTYGSTLLSWADLPIGPLANRPSHADVLQALMKPLLAAKR